MNIQSIIDRCAAINGRFLWTAASVAVTLLNPVALDAADASMGQVIASMSVREKVQKELEGTPKFRVSSTRRIAEERKDIFDVNLYWDSDGNRLMRTWYTNPVSNEIHGGIEIFEFFGTEVRKKSVQMEMLGRPLLAEFASNESIRLVYPQNKSRAIAEIDLSTGRIINGPTVIDFRPKHFFRLPGSDSVGLGDGKQSVVLDKALHFISSKDLENGVPEVIDVPSLFGKKAFFLKDGRRALVAEAVIGQSKAGDYRYVVGNPMQKGKLIVSDFGDRREARVGHRRSSGEWSLSSDFSPLSLNGRFMLRLVNTISRATSDFPDAGELLIVDLLTGKPHKIFRSKIGGPFPYGQIFASPRLNRVAWLNGATNEIYVTETGFDSAE